MLRIWYGLPRGVAEKERYLSTLKLILESPNRSKQFEHLYGNLSVLDTKPGSLLQYNSILIGVSTINLLFEPSQIRGLHAMLLLSFVAIMVSALILLTVVWVHWSTTGEMTDEREHILQLIQIRDQRTVRYRTAWWLSMTGMWLLLIYGLIKFWDWPLLGRLLGQLGEPLQRALGLPGS